MRNVSVAAIDKNGAATKAAEQQAVANAQALAASIEPFYGAGAKDGFFKLLAGHYGAVKAYLVATVAGDAAGQGTATQSLTSNAEEIAIFLSKANPYLPKDAVQGLLLAHGGHHIQQIQQLKDRKYEAEATNLGRDEEARLSNRRCDGRRPGEAIRQEVLLNNIGPTH